MTEAAALSLAGLAVLTFFVLVDDLSAAFLKVFEPFTLAGVVLVLVVLAVVVLVLTFFAAANLAAVLATPIDGLMVDDV